MSFITVPLVLKARLFLSSVFPSDFAVAGAMGVALKLRTAGSSLIGRPCVYADHLFALYIDADQRLLQLNLTTL